MLTRKLGRKKAHREHMLRNLAASVLLHEQVETTEAKAKEVRKLIDQSIRLAQKNSLAARRQLEAIYFDSSVVTKLFDVYAKRFSDRQSGFSHLISTGLRHGDGAERVMVKLVAGLQEEKKEKKSPSAKKEAAPKDEATDKKESDDAK